jgi:hypothetical protein
MYGNPAAPDQTGAKRPGFRLKGAARLLRCHKVVLPEKEEDLMGRFARKEPINRSQSRSANANVRAAFTGRDSTIKAWRSRRALTSSRAENAEERIIKFDNSSGPNKLSSFFKGRFALSGRKRKVARLATVGALALIGLMVGWGLGGALTDSPAASANKISKAQPFTSVAGDAPAIEQSSPTSEVQPEAHATKQSMSEQPSAESEPKSRRARVARQRGNYAGDGFNPTVIVTRPAKVIKKANPLKIGKIF